jgi:6-phosphofructokinase 1
MRGTFLSQNGKIKAVGILTAGGDCPGLNAVIRAITKSLLPEGVRVYGFIEGFRGLVENRYIELDDYQTSGLLTIGGTVLRTSRDKPHKMPSDNGATDRIGEVGENVKSLGLDCVVCIGGGGTHKNVSRIMERSRVNFVTVPKTIDNDVWGTDTCVGFDTAMAIATEALDRLHTTASSHHRVMVVDIMGHNAGWLALGSGVAGGADVILIPEIPYDLDIAAESLRARMERGKMFSLVAVAEGAISMEEALARKSESGRPAKKRKKGIEHSKEPVSAILAEHLEDATGLETRVTSLGHIQRGGIPTPTDRLLATKYGTQAAEFILERKFGVMVAKRGQEFVGVPIEEVADRRRHVPLNHPWISAARLVGTCLGDEMPHGYKASQRTKVQRA